MLSACMRQTTHEYTLCYAYRSFIHFARKACVKQAIDTNCDYLLFLDDDMVWQPNMPARLIAIAEHYKYDIVSGYYTTRKELPYPLIYRRRENGMYSPVLPREDFKDALFECDATGFGAILIRTNVFKRVPEPWFELPDSTTEDIYFFNKCNDLGIKTYVDAGLPCGHKGDWGWNFPYSCDMEKYVKGNIVRADEALRDSEQLYYEGEQNAERKESAGGERGTGRTKPGAAGGPVILREHPGAGGKAGNRKRTEISQASNVCLE